MPRLWHRLRTAHAASFGMTGHTHTDLQPDHQGNPRLVLDCPPCQEHAHPEDWSTRPADVHQTWDEEQDEKRAVEQQGRLTPAVTEMIARVVAEMNGRLLPASGTSPTPAAETHISEDVVRALVLAELARQQTAANVDLPAPTLRVPEQPADAPYGVTADGAPRRKPGPKPKLTVEV